MTSFEQLYINEYKYFLRYIKHQFINLQNQEDVLQDAFVIFYEKYYKLYNPELSNGKRLQEIHDVTGIALSTIKSRISKLRIYFCNEYTKITGIKMEFTRKKDIKTKQRISAQKRKTKKILQNLNLVK